MQFSIEAESQTGLLCLVISNCRKSNGVYRGTVPVTTDLEIDLIGGLLNCDLEQINAIPNQYGRFLDLVFFRMRCGLAYCPFLDLIVPTGQWKQAGSGLSSVLLIAWQ
jgi:hypothetical protein